MRESGPIKPGARSPVAIVQARMGSTRLPGKVLHEVMGEPLLARQLERLQRIRADVRVIVATTENAADDPIVDLCESIGIPVYRGSEDDVLERYAEAAAYADADPVIRITADCPFIDPAISRLVLERYEAGDCDYASNTLVRTYPRGLDTEVFAAARLGQASREARTLPEREHVTPYFYQHPDRFRLCSVENETDLSTHRWTVDTAEDVQFVTEVLERLIPMRPAFAMEDVLAVLQSEPALREINSHVVQKATLR
jgi:spore coat polysaccharide biosynthesis protein SpsF